MTKISCSIDYKDEYEFRREIHYKTGVILRLEYVNEKHRREIERLNRRINTILATEDSPQDLFEYIKSLIVELSHKKGREHIDPNEIDLKYVEAAVRYTMPGLFSMYALLSEDDKHRIELADSLLWKFGV